MQRRPKPEELLSRLNLQGHPASGHGGGGTDPGCQRLSLVHPTGEASDCGCCSLGFPRSPEAFFLPFTPHPGLLLQVTPAPLPARASCILASASYPSLFQTSLLPFPSSDSQLLPCLLLASFLCLSGLWATWPEDFQGYCIRQAPSPLS